MALIACKECKKEISDTVSKCPVCGFKMVKPASPVTIIVMVIIGCIIVASCLGSLNKPSKENPVNYSNSPVPLDAGAYIEEPFTRNNFSTLVAAINLIKLNGNTCDSVRTARASVYDGTFVISCNDLKYEYEIKDVGGKIDFKVIR